MIIKFNNYIKENKMSALVEPSDSDIEEAEKILSEGKNPDMDMKEVGCFYIDVSGKYSVYYTFWRWNPRSANSRYICNLSTDFITAVKKAAKASGRIPVIIDRFGTYAGLFKASKAEILTFGKYRGKTLGEIFVDDPQYIMWLSQNYNSKNAELYNKIIEYKNMYLETITKKNIEESKSEYVGEIGKKIEVEANVYNYQENMSNFGIQYTCKLIDEKGNKYIVYNIGRKVKKGDTIIMNAKVKDHKELLGIKFTVLYYCKILKIFNIEDDASKYNL